MTLQEQHEGTTPEQRRELWWALRTRALTDAEWEVVKWLDWWISVNPGAPFQEEERRREFNEVLFRACQMRPAVRALGADPDSDKGYSDGGHYQFSSDAVNFTLRHPPIDLALGAVLPLLMKEFGPMVCYRIQMDPEGEMVQCSALWEGSAVEGHEALSRFTEQWISGAWQKLPISFHLRLTERRL